MPNYLITQLDTIEPVPCPCGLASRAFGGDEVASLHLVEISVDSVVHYHKKMTELYLVLEGEGNVELDGTVFPVKPMTAIMIKPGCRHRAVGKLRVVNIPIPAFDPADEWFDDDDAHGHGS